VLKLNCDIPLSTSAFKFNLRRYTVEGAARADIHDRVMDAIPGACGLQARGQSDKISHIDTFVFHIDTFFLSTSTISILSSSISILCRYCHHKVIFHVDTAILLSCGQAGHIISCHTARGLLLTARARPSLNLLLHPHTIV